MILKLLLFIFNQKQIHYDFIKMLISIFFITYIKIIYFYKNIIYDLIIILIFIYYKIFFYIFNLFIITKLYFIFYKT